eukprot:5967165-Prymnesium_polylepis.1
MRPAPRARAHSNPRRRAAACGPRRRDQRNPNLPPPSGSHPWDTSTQIWEGAAEPKHGRGRPEAPLETPPRTPG